MKQRTAAFLASITVAVTAVMAAATTSASDIQLTPLVADVLWAPQPVRGSDGHSHLVYELRLANPTPLAISLEKVEVLDGGGAIVATLGKDAVGQRFSIGGRRGAEATSLAVGQFGVLFLHVPIESTQIPPTALTHRVSGSLAGPNVPSRSFTLTVGPTRVADETRLVLGPPLVGEGYLAGDGCCDSIRHVRALLPLDGRFALAQRFAIDWEQVGADRRLVKGDLKKVENYNIFGKDVIAVADGTVVATRNDLPEQVPGALPEGLPVDEADGNFVVLDIGNGAYALFAHMQPGSVRVTAGAKVKRGDVLGKVGNTGNTSAPHLHFHVMDGPSPLLSNGIPYVIDRFRTVAVATAGTADFDKAEATGSPLTLATQDRPPALQRVLPMDLTVVDFPK